MTTLEVREIQGRISMIKKKPQDLTVRDRQSVNRKIAKLSEQIKKLRLTVAVQGVELERHKKILNKLLQVN